jgi:hypothetical protein
MKESETRCAKIEVVKLEDFIRFLEYAYRGDFTVPPWEEGPANPSSVPSTVRSEQPCQGESALISQHLTSESVTHPLYREPPSAPVRGPPRLEDGTK